MSILGRDCHIKINDDKLRLYMSFQTCMTMCHDFDIRFPYYGQIVENKILAQKVIIPHYESDKSIQSHNFAIIIHDVEFITERVFTESL